MRGRKAYPVIAAGVTVVRAVHVAELRTSLKEVYEAANLAPPSYSTPLIVAGQSVTAAQIQELRLAVLVIW